MRAHESTENEADCVARTYFFVRHSLFIPRLLTGQGTSPVDLQLARTQRQDASDAAINHLRVGNVEQALKRLESFASAGHIDLSCRRRCSLASVLPALNRALSQLSSEAQFDLLSKWSMPAESPPKIRVLTILVPTLAPPAEFARELGERPRSTSFPVSSIGEVRGIFSTAWSLVVAARESGRLKRLLTDVGQLVDNQIPNADLVLALAQIADARGDVSKLAELFSTRVIQLKRPDLPNVPARMAIDPANVVLACAALQHPALRSQGEELLAALVDSTYGQSGTLGQPLHGQPAGNVRPFLRKAHATAVLLNHPDHSEAGSLSKLESRLKYWVPVSGIRAGSDSSGTTDATAGWSTKTTSFFGIRRLMSKR